MSGRVILLNEGIRPRLVRKLEEYRSRLDPYRAPERQSATNYKLVVLERLLNSGEVDTFALASELKEKYGWIAGDLYVNACAVIEDYNLTGGAHTHGGTGLPEVEG